jgi:hypothetical protein
MPELTDSALCSAARAAALRLLSSVPVLLVLFVRSTAGGFDTAVVGAILCPPFVAGGLAAGGPALGAVGRVPRR